MAAGIGNDDVNGEIVTFDCAVVAGEAVGAIVDLKAKRLTRIYFPSTFTACNVTFEVGHTATVAPFYDGSTEYTLAAAPGRAVLVDFSKFFGVQFVKLKFSANQPTASTLKLVGVPR